MLDIVKNMTINEKEYPIAFTLNVMEAIQDKYGSMKEWGDILQPPKNEEPKIKDIKWTFTQFINEGIDIEDEEKNEKRTLLTEKQVGRLITIVGMDKINKEMMLVTAESMKTDNPNEMTTQNQMNQ